MTEATNTNANLGGVDFSQYQTWPSVTTPSGGVYYAVPGTAFVYDPFMSAAKGKPVLYRNPSPRLKAEADAKKIQDDAIAAQKRASSPLGQLAPIGGGVAGIVGAKWAIDKLGPTDKLTEALVNKIGGETAANTATQAAANTAATNTAAVTQAVAPTTASEAFTASAIPTNVPVSTPAISTPVPPGTFESIGTAPGAEAGTSTFGSILPSNAGTLPTAGGALALAAFLSNIYEGGGKDIIRGNGKKDDYTNLVLDINPVTAPVNMALRALGLPSVGRRLSTGKSEEQQIRDDFRSHAQGLGIADNDYKVNFSDGGSFDIGKDGGARLTNDKGEQRRYFEIDSTNPLASYAVSKIDPLVYGLYGGQRPQQGEQFSAMLINAVTEGAKDQATVDRRISELAPKFQTNNEGGQVAAQPAQAQPIVNNSTPSIPRSSTISPGIAKDGTRIDYNRMGRELASRLDGRSR